MSASQQSLSYAAYSRLTTRRPIRHLTATSNPTRIYHRNSTLRDQIENDRAHPDFGIRDYDPADERAT